MAAYVGGSDTGLDKTAALMGSTTEKLDHIMKVYYKPMWEAEVAQKMDAQQAKVIAQVAQQQQYQHAMNAQNMYQNALAQSQQGLGAYSASLGQASVLNTPLTTTGTGSIVFNNEPIVCRSPILPHTPKRSLMKSIFDEFSAYLKAHRDLILTLGLVFLADHFLLKGALKVRLQAVIESVLNKAEKKLEGQ